MGQLVISESSVPIREHSRVINSVFWFTKLYRIVYTYCDVAPSYIRILPIIILSATGLTTYIEYV